jgi:hypothetical protein
MKVIALPLCLAGLSLEALPLSLSSVDATALPLATRFTVEALPAAVPLENFILDEDDEPLTDEDDQPLEYG